MHTSNSEIRFQWPLRLLSLLLLVGIGIGSYMTWHHENELYGDSSVSLANCPENSLINCEVVNTSRYSEFLGVPIAVFAIPTYALLLLLVFWRKKHPISLRYVFWIGILTTIYSIYLFYVSKVQIGYLCVWCFRLYLINLSIPVLTAIAYGKSPGHFLKDLATLFDFKQDSQKIVLTSFAALLTLSLIGQKSYRASLKRIETKTNQAANEQEIINWSPKQFKFPRQVKRVEIVNHEITTTEFDLQQRVGKGKPLALFYHTPGYNFSESVLEETEKYIRENLKNTEFYIIVGRIGENRIEAAWEGIRSLGISKDTPILVDESYSLLQDLEIQESPNLTLVSADGTLIALRLHSLTAKIPGETNTNAKEILAKVDSGASDLQYKITPQHFPTDALVGKCAPSFTLNDIMTGVPHRFLGKSANGKPTLLVFWSSTCKHCQKEIPELVRNQHANPSYNIVSISNIKADRTDGTSHRNITKAYIKNTGIQFPVLVDSGRVLSLYGIISTPTSLMVAPNGQITEAWYYVHSNIDEAITKAVTKAKSITGSCENYVENLPAKLNFSALGPDNQLVSMSKIIDRPSLVHLWATWCGPCQAELPSLLAFKQELEKNKGKVHLVSVEDDTAAEKISSFLSKYGKNLTSLRNPTGGIAEDFNLGYQVPRTYLLSAKGEILMTYNGTQKWDDPAFKERVYAWLQLSAENKVVTESKH